MKTYKIPNFKKILKPRWSHKPGFGMNKNFEHHRRKSFQQSTSPEDERLLKKLGIKKEDKVLAVAGYYASWASAIARLEVNVAYSDISSSIVSWAKKEYGKLFSKYICSNYELIPKKENQYDWTFTFEACGGGSGLPIAYLRSLLNKKGGILVYHLRYGKDKKKMGSKPRMYPLIVKTLSGIYGAKYIVKGINVKSHQFEKPTKMIPHKICIIKTNSKARTKAMEDIVALERNKFTEDTLKRLNKLANILSEEYTRKVKVK